MKRNHQKRKNLQLVFNLFTYWPSFLIIIGITSFICKPIQGDEEAAVREAALDYVEAFYEGDTAKLKRSMSMDVFKFGYYRERGESGYSGEPMTYKDMLDYTISVKERGSVDDRAPKKIEVLDIQNQTACAKLTAWWGTDYILLGKESGKWIIREVLWQSHPKK